MTTIIVIGFTLLALWLAFTFGELIAFIVAVIVIAMVLALLIATALWLIYPASAVEEQ